MCKHPPLHPAVVVVVAALDGGGVYHCTRWFLPFELCCFPLLLLRRAALPQLLRVMFFPTIRNLIELLVCCSSVYAAPLLLFGGVFPPPSFEECCFPAILLWTNVVCPRPSWSGRCCPPLPFWVLFGWRCFFTSTFWEVVTMTMTLREVHPTVVGGLALQA